MSTLTFDGTAHTLTLRDSAGDPVSSGTANNRTDSHATLQFVSNGTYNVLTQSAPRRHSGDKDSLNGEYGTFGIVVFDVPGHVGVGVHAGRLHKPDLTPQRAMGPNHVTQGCIRTTEEMMGTITTLMREDPLISVVVVNNRKQR